MQDGNPEGNLGSEGQLGQPTESQEPEPTQEVEPTSADTQDSQDGLLGLQREQEQKPASPDKPVTSDPWHGKSREEVIRMFENQKEIVNELGQKNQAYEQYLRQVQAQQQQAQVRTYGPDRQPYQAYPQQKIDLKTAQEAAYEGKYELMERYIAQQADERANRRLAEVLQMSQAQQKQAYDQQIAALDGMLDVAARKSAMARGLKPQQVKTEIYRRLQEDQSRLNEIFQNPWGYDQNRIEQGVEELLNITEKSEEEKFEKFLQKRGLTFDQAKQYAEAQKKAAAGQIGGPAGQGSGKLGGKDVSGVDRSPEDEEYLRLLGI